jgi:hypothetical protein
MYSDNEIKNILKVIDFQEAYGFNLILNFYRDKNNITKPFEGTIKDFINKFSKENNDVKSLLKSFIMLKIKVLEKALFDLKDSYGICLSDITKDNIVYITNKDGTYDLVFNNVSISKNLDITSFKQTIDDINCMLNI